MVPDGSPSSAEALFARWLRRHETGAEEPIDELLARRPEHAGALRELHAQWARLERIRRERGLTGSLSERLRSVHGSQVDPRVELEHEDEVDSTSRLLERLARRAPSPRRYRLKGEVAHGGMGSVLRVWDESLRRHLAMKVMLGQGEAESSGDTPPVDQRQLARFLEEAQVTGQLDHPGIVPVHELGLDSDGRVYFTMKLVRGQTLSAVLGELRQGEGGWTQASVLGLLLKVCEAMSYAHAKGVIHRDLKPANVMVGKFGEVYVMDWGLAKILGREDGEETGIVLVLLPGGSSWMGAQKGEPGAPNHDPWATDSEGPVHRVLLSPFFLAKHEMTQGQWLRIAGRNPSHNQPPASPSLSLLHPVEQVSWTDCMRWLPRVGLELPSEARWEYGARAGTETPWWTGRERESLRELHAANLADRTALAAGATWSALKEWPELDDGWALHAPVGTYAPNAFGLHEVIGNVWEWCLDGFAPSYEGMGTAPDPFVPWQDATRRVNRVGSFGGNARVARSASRDDDAPTDADGNLGLRPARSVER